jgi:hypothetical protein
LGLVEFLATGATLLGRLAEREVRSGERGSQQLIWPRPDPTRQLAVTKAGRTVAAASAAFVVPAIIADAGEHATRRFLEFFAATIRNKNTRTAYLHAVSRFFAWCGTHRRGACVVAVYTKDVAEAKATNATDAGRSKGYPLLSTTEPEE